MRSPQIAAAIVVSIAFAGCTTKREVLVGVGVGVGVAGLGGFLAFAPPTSIGGCRDCAEKEDSVLEERLTGYALLSISGVILFGAILNSIYLATKHNDETEQPTRDPPVSDKDASSRFDRRAADVWVLTEQARSASGQDDCETVRRLAPQVLDLDAEFYAAVFHSDLAIQRCLLPTVTPPTEREPTDQELP